MELYHWEPVGDSAGLLILLEEKAIEYRGHYIDILGFEQYNDDHLQRTAMARVPVLAVEGKYLDVPNLAMQYLVEAFTPRLAPQDPRGWYEIQAWANVLDAGLRTSVSLLGWNTVMLPRMGASEREEFNQKYADRPVRERQAGWSEVFSDAEADEDQLTNARGRIRDAIAKIEAGLCDNGWLVGGEYSVADIHAFALCHTLPRLTPDIVNEEATPRMMQWLQNIENRPAVAKTLGRSRYNEDIYAPPG
ncbi:MAG: glutathione S-transferase family protein [Gammaproteobacteria bacterium]